MKKKTIDIFGEAKTKDTKLSMLTVYDYTTACIFDEEGVDILLVGDSLGMVCLGHKDTLSVTMEDMLHHTKAVTRAAQRALVLGDMPFMSYQVSDRQAVKNAGRLIQEGQADCIKLEGGTDYCSTIKAIIRAQIPVVGHLGLTPQSVKAFGGFKVQGKTKKAAQRILEDALRLQDAGISALVLEGIPSLLAKKITEELDIATIGIGAGVHCNGQVLVYQDMLNLYNGINPKFVKQFADVGQEVRKGVQHFIKEVQEGTFPDDSHSFLAGNDEIATL